MPDPDAPVDTVIEDRRWDAAGLPRLAAQATGATLRHLGLTPGDWEIVVLGCDDTRIAALNGAFRDRTRPTNVLSWPGEDRAARRPGAVPDLPDPDRHDAALGDIAIAFETVMAEAADGGIDPSNHVTHLLVHATLHLLGYDHETDADAALMEGLETRILAGLGVADPYGDAAPSGPGKDE